MAYSNQSKNTASYSNQSISGTNDFLLQEDSYYLLLEDGFKILIRRGGASSYSNQTKNSASYSNQTKN